MKKIINFIKNKKGTIDPFPLTFAIVVGVSLIGVILILAL